MDRDLLASSRRPNLSAELGRYRDGELDGELGAGELPGELDGGGTSILFGEGGGGPRRRDGRRPRPAPGAARRAGYQTGPGGSGPLEAQGPWDEW